jgi:tRNA threonylcarbamoyladenosine biosynthesis protein TsaE
MKISSIIDLENIVINVKKKILPGDHIFLYGEIGVGKTTFARLLINQYETENNLKKSEVLSPTFNIVFEYKIKNFNVKHYDLYRLKNEADIKNIGLFENSEQSIILIEWPELIKKKPLNRIDLFFKYTKDMNNRFLNIKTSGRLKSYEFKL